MAAPSLEPARPATIRLAFAPDPTSIRAVSTAIRGFLSEQGVADRELFSYELCIAEAANNAVEHARGPARHLKPVAEALFTPSQIELRVTDHTAGFELPDHIPPPSPLRERGRGLFMIQSAMDEVRYLRGPTENILIMRKRRRVFQQGPSSPEGASLEALTLEECRSQLAEAQSEKAAMEGELSFRSETLASVFRCCAELGNSDEISDGFGGRLLVDLLHLTSADWYVLRLLAPDGRQLAVAAASDAELFLEPIALAAPGDAAQGFESLAAAKRAPTGFDLRECVDRTEPLLAVGAEATGLVCPLSFGGALVGTLAVGRRTGDFPLGKLQNEVVRTFAEFLAIQTLGIRRRREEVRNRVVERELEIANEIQHLLLPRTLPQLAGFGLAGGWQSAREVGGDFYDAIAVDGHSLVLMIADVMGKGVPAALFATTMRGLLRGLVERSADPAQVLSGLNRLLFPELSSVNMFITAQVVHVNLESRQVTAAGAGHCPVLFIPPGRGAVSALHTEGLPLGVLPETAYRRATTLLGNPAALLLHTDGLTDTRNPDGKAFSQRRLKGWMAANIVPGRPATDVRDRLATELNRYRDGATMADDQAFLLLAEETADGANHVSRGGRRVRLQRGSFLFSANTRVAAKT